MKAIKANNYKQFTLFDYESKKTTHKYDLGTIVFKKSELEEESQTPIGVIIQLHSDGDYRTEMYGNVSESEIRPATWEEIYQYAPKLMNYIHLPKKRIKYEGQELIIGECMESYMNSDRPVFINRVIAPNGGHIPVKVQYKETLKSIGYKAIETLDMFKKRGADVHEVITKPLNKIYDEIKS